MITHLLLTFVLSLPTFAFGNEIKDSEVVDLSQNRMLSLMLIPQSSRAVVGLVGPQGLAGFAICDMEKSTPVECRLNYRQRFPIAEMPLVRQRFETILRDQLGGLRIEGFELGVLSGLRLSPGEVGLYYAMKARRSVAVSEAAIAEMGRLFNTNLNSPLFVRPPSYVASTSVQVIAALQFAASRH